MFKNILDISDTWLPSVKKIMFGLGNLLLIK
jgi:hypothetical protein